MDTVDKQESSTGNDREAAGKAKMDGHGRQVGQQESSPGNLGKKEKQDKQDISEGP